MKFSIFHMPQFKSNLHNQMQQTHLQVDMGLIRYTLQDFGIGGELEDVKS